jgi:hypothetical protein
LASMISIKRSLVIGLRFAMCVPLPGKMPEREKVFVRSLLTQGRLRWGTAEPLATALGGLPAA